MAEEDKIHIPPDIPYSFGACNFECGCKHYENTIFIGRLNNETDRGKIYLFENTLKGYARNWLRKFQREHYKGYDYETLIRNFLIRFSQHVPGEGRPNHICRRDSSSEEESKMEAKEVAATIVKNRRHMINIKQKIDFIHEDSVGIKREIECTQHMVNHSLDTLSYLADEVGKNSDYTKDLHRLIANLATSIQTMIAVMVEDKIGIKLPKVKMKDRNVPDDINWDIYSPTPTYTMNPEETTREEEAEERPPSTAKMKKEQNTIPTKEAHKPLTKRQKRRIKQKMKRQGINELFGEKEDSSE